MSNKKLSSVPGKSTAKTSQSVSNAAIPLSASRSIRSSAVSRASARLRRGSPAEICSAELTPLRAATLSLRLGLGQSRVLVDHVSCATTADAEDWCFDGVVHDALFSLELFVKGEDAAW